MNPTLSEWLNLIFRWAHLLAGILWIGHLYFFNFVNAQLVKTYTPESKKAVLPELMPRALFWFRQGALITWVTGILLLGIVYYHGGLMVDPDRGQSSAAAMAVSLGGILFLFFAYDGLWRIVGKNELVGAAVLFAVFLGLNFVLWNIMSPRALYIHDGALFGSIMMMNVWMRIWPAQKKIINAVKGLAPAPDPSVPAMAGLRSKHNTYLSVPLLFFMLSNHFPTVYGSDLGWLYAGGFVLVGFGIAKRLYVVSAGPAPAKVPAPEAAAATPAVAPKA